MASTKLSETRVLPADQGLQSLGGVPLLGDDVGGVGEVEVGEELDVQLLDVGQPR